MINGLENNMLINYLIRDVESELYIPQVKKKVLF